MAPFIEYGELGLGISSRGDAIIGEAPIGEGYGAGYVPPMRSSMPTRGLSGSWLKEDRSDIVLPVLAFLVRLLGSGPIADVVSVLAVTDNLSSSCLLSFFASSSSVFFGFFGAPNALNHALRFGVAELFSTGFSTTFGSGFGLDVVVEQVSSFSFSSFSLASISVDVMISSSSMSSESLSREASSLSSRSAVNEI